VLGVSRHSFVIVP